MNDKKQQPAQRRSNTLTWVLLVGALLVAVAGPTVIILLFGLLPTFVAYIIDRSQGKSATFTVGSINLIGVFPYIINLWENDNTFNHAFTITTDLVSMLAMYASSAFGWLIFLGLPTIIASFVVIMQQRKVAQLRGEQKELIEEWGATVASIVEAQRDNDQEKRLQKGG